LDISSEVLREHLCWIDPDIGRDLWLRVGAALHHQFEGNDEGLKLFDEWSQGLFKRDGNKTAEKYVVGEPEKTWRSFKGRRASRLVTASTIIWLANQVRGKDKIILKPKKHAVNARLFLDCKFNSPEGWTLIRVNNSWLKYCGTHYKEITHEELEAAAWKWLETCYKIEEVK
jgi:hypothetical protein